MRADEFDNTRRPNPDWQIFTGADDASSRHNNPLYYIIGIINLFFLRLSYVYYIDRKIKFNIVTLNPRIHLFAARLRSPANVAYLCILLTTVHVKKTGKKSVLFGASFYPRIPLSCYERISFKIFSNVSLC